MAAAEMVLPSAFQQDAAQPFFASRIAGRLRDTNKKVLRDSRVSAANVRPFLTVTFSGSAVCTHLLDSRRRAASDILVLSSFSSN